VASAVFTGPVSAPSQEFPGGYQDLPLKGVRKIVAERMMNSLATSAQLTYTATANAAGLLAMRAKFKNSDPELGLNGVTIGDLVGYATVHTLQNHHNVNSTLADGVWRQFEEVHLGMAVDTPRGLIVPTLQFANRIRLREFSNLSKQLAAESADGSIHPDLLSGATFTVSNLGSFGIENFTPIINTPQTAILGVNTIVPRAVANKDGSVGVEQRIGFSLTADHRVIDGADAARFLRDLCRAIENIELIVLL
jgi:pyruvate dehydrogenase E2 component (dihydrolipoamide acetyltransferase)